MTKSNPRRPLDSEYLEWARAHGTVKYSLAISGVPPFDVSLLSPSVDDFTMVADNEYGWPPLLERIARRYGVKPENVVLAHGTSMANHLACAALVEPGDRVLIETPVYDPLVAVPRYLGCEVDFFTRRSEYKYLLDVDNVERTLTPRTRLVILSNLHNPTGALAGHAELQSLARLAESRDVHVLVDEVYLEWLYGASVDPAMKSAINISPRFVTTRSLTKVFGLAALRAGWILADADIAVRMRRLNGLFASSMSHPAERLAARALDRAEMVLETQRRRLERNRAIATEFVASQPKLSWLRPVAGTVGFVRLEGGDVDGLVQRLLANETLVTPGRFFGDEVSDHFRIGFGMEQSHLEEGLRRLGSALA
ncbi:MAG TPA: pyridoxal phosphate-dependent aminotransferase [Gemmatimonadaceae bacterium]|nr:pyridoxal phosphate-dependent aminotransferase [Gemmatimonadaceae bacterium]